MKKPTLRYLLPVLISIAVLTACATQRKLSSLTAPSPTAGTYSSETPPAAAATIASDVPSDQAAAQSAALANPSTATKQGWWIRINPRVTTAPAIALQIGTDKFHREEWLVWVSDSSSLKPMCSTPRLYLRGNVSPIGKMADLCLMYKGRGVEHMGFNDDESETKSQTAVDFKCRM
jgi:hypothetical protein